MSAVALRFGSVWAISFDHPLHAQPPGMPATGVLQVERLDMTYHPERPLRDQLQELLVSKIQMLADSNFLDLARVAIAATIHSPERAQNMVSRLNEREESFTAWIRAAQADGRFKTLDPSFAAAQTHALLKAFAFWPQITLGAPALAPAAQMSVIESALDLFLGGYEIPA